jgi:hypothetical protein
LIRIYIHWAVSVGINTNIVAFERDLCLSKIPYLATMSSADSSSRGNRNTPKQHRCEICGKSFDTLDTIDSHKRRDHSESGKGQSPAGIG